MRATPLCSGHAHPLSHGVKHGQRKTARSWSLDRQAASHPLQLYPGVSRVQGRYMWVSQTDPHGCQQFTRHCGLVWGAPSVLPSITHWPTESVRIFSDRSPENSPWTLRRSPASHIFPQLCGAIGGGPSLSHLLRGPDTPLAHPGVTETVAALGCHPVSPTPGLQPSPYTRPMGDRLHRQA